jgi:hypothetical protein
LPGPARTSVLAIVSLIFGLLGCTLVGAMVGLVCGIIAMVRISKSGGRLKGDGLALAGIIVSAATLLIAPFILAGMLLPALAKARSKAQTVTSVNNLKQMGLAARIYSTDHGNKFPASTNWTDTLRPDLGPGSEKVLHRPTDGPDKPCGYGYNLQVAGLPEDSVAPQTVLFFELETPACDAVGGKELLRRPKNSRDVVVVGLADGSVMQVRQDHLAQLRWQP